ncbi:Transcription factor ILR3 [Linum grandiflorum]
MVSPADNPNWVFDYALIEDLPLPGGELPSLDPPPAQTFWRPSPFPHSASLRFSVPFSDSSENSDCLKENGSRKRMHRVKVGPSNVPSSKACREKMRRDRLNDRFLELSAIIDPARPPKSDKSAILADAARMVSQLRGEADKLKETNASLQEKITELKAEKSELRDEKQRLKTEKEQLERQVKAISCPPPGSMAAKLMPFVGYPQVSMWQFMPPAAVDTSQDHAIRPPVA